MSDSEPPQKTLTSITSSLDALDEAIAPITNQPWNEIISKLSLLDKTKMDILGAYLVNDLIWVYLKLKGVDPSKHEVTGELERIRTYYSKVASLAGGNVEPQPKIDVAAAHRFISASIPRAEHLPPTSAAELAASQALRASREEAKEDSIRELNKSRGKAGRFKRHIKDEGETIKLVPGQNSDMEEINEDVSMIEHDGQEQAEEFLKHLAKEIDNQEKQ
ncbi:uncharacterized protein L203_103428 [Cryptococcus depauperatus CBS 7841]|uniref:Exosome complex protein n=1 Tax=Cryptococcus depauperatus CBS 7841 TaxID=1295531 RepID=A0AAJ8JTT4_9TREE